MSISSASEPESSLITFAACYPRCQFLTSEGGDKRKRKWREGRDYSREAIILNIFVKGG